MATPPQVRVPVLGDTAGPRCGRGSAGLTREAVGLGHGVAVWVPLPGLLHLPLVEEVAQARPGVQAVPREGRHPWASNPSSPKDSTWERSYCRGCDSYREHIQGHFLIRGGIEVVCTPYARCHPVRAGLVPQAGTLRGGIAAECHQEGLEMAVPAHSPGGKCPGLP